MDEPQRLDMPAAPAVLPATESPDAWLRFVCEALHGYVYTFNIATGLVDRSATFTAVTGWPADEAAPTPEWWIARIHPADLARVRSELEACRLDPACIQAEAVYRIQRRDGTWMHVSDRQRFVRDALGRVTRIVGVAHDVTDRLQAEDALRQREAVIARQLAELEAIYQHAPIGLCVFDRELRYLRINERLAEMNGIPAAAHLGRTVRELVPDLASTLEGFARRVLETGEPVRDLPLSGETAREPGVVRHWLEQWYPLFDGDGAVIGLNVVVEEVTERRRAEAALAASEARYRLATEVAAVGTWTWDVLADTATFDDTVRELFAFDREAAWPRAEILATRVHPEDRARVAAALAGAADPRGDGRYRAEYRVLRPDGTVRWARAAGLMRFADVGREAGVDVATDGAAGAARRPVELLGTVVDVTEAYAREARLEEAAAAERTARERMERLQSLTAALAAATSVDAVADVLVAEGLAATGGTTVAVALRERDADGNVVDEARVLRQRGLPDDVASAFVRFPVNGTGSASTAMRSGVPVFVERRDGTGGLFARFPAARALWERLGAHAVAAIPLMRNGVAVGVLSVTYGAARTFDDGERAFFTTLGGQAVQALARAESRAAELTARDRAETLQRVTARLASAQTPQDVSRFFSEELTTLVAADTAWVGRVTTDGTALEALGWAGYDDETVARWQRMLMDSGIALTEVVRRGEPEWWESRDALIAAYPKREASIRAAGQAAVALIPLFPSQPDHDSSATGGMVIGFRSPMRFDTGTRAFFLSLAQQCAQALERTRLFEAERQARAEAEAASRAKGDFLANMSHELRTPLNAIAGHVQLLEMGLHGPVTPAQAEAFGRVQHAGRHLLGLINDVLNYAKLEAGRVEFDLRDVDLRQVLERTVPLVEPQRLARGLLLEVVTPPDTVRARCDEEKVGQVLLNLLSNAVKFTPEGGRIAVRVFMADEGACIEVVDTGVGIPADRLDAVFEPFVQVNASRARGHEGTGLGLTISRDLARGMGGDLTVTSALGRGSTFRLVVPAGA